MALIVKIVLSSADAEVEREDDVRGCAEDWEVEVKPDKAEDKVEEEDDCSAVGVTVILTSSVLTMAFVLTIVRSLVRNTVVCAAAVVEVAVVSAAAVVLVDAGIVPQAVLVSDTYPNKSAVSEPQNS